MPAAMTALKALATAIRLAFDWMNVQTAMARLTRVRRIDCNHLNACLDCLVGNKQSQLIERPAIRTSSLRFGARQFVGAFSDACQVLDGDHRFKRFGLLHNGFADSMVQPLLIAPLSARQPLQDLSRSSASRPCAFRAFRLERCSNSRKPISNFLNVLTVPLFALRRNRDVSASEVNANHVARFDWLRGFILQLDVQIELAVTMLAQLSAGWLAAFELASLVVASIQLDSFASLHRGETDFPLFLSKGEQVSVAVHAGRCKFLNGLAFELCRFAICADTSASPHRHVCHQVELGFDGLVGQRLQNNLVGNLGFGMVVDVVASCRKRAESCLQFGDLLRSRLKLYNDGQDLFHEYEYTTCGMLKQWANSASLHSPRYPPTTRFAEVVAPRVSVGWCGLGRRTVGVNWDQPRRMGNGF